MAKIPTYEEMIKEAAEEALDGYIYKGKTLREWIELLAHTRWIPVSERLPIEEFKQGRKEGWVYDLYPCLVTRTASHSRENPNRIYVAKHYFDGEDFLNNGGDICNEVLAWMPLPEPYKTESEGKE